MMTITKARQILGKDFTAATDQEIEGIINFLTLIARIEIDEINKKATRASSQSDKPSTHE